MIKAEYIRNLNRNFVRVRLDEQPDRKRYQYCIMDRGGLKHLLQCGHESIDGENYLYYDISSVQNVKQLFSEKYIRREWMKDFLWGMEKLRQELDRFLLDERNVVWMPEYIFQDLEQNTFQFLYVPYYGQEGRMDCSFERILEFWVERGNYEDEALVEFIYHAYEQYMQIGQNYLGKQIFDDFKKVLAKNPLTVGKENSALSGEKGDSDIPEDKKDSVRPGSKGKLSIPEDEKDTIRPGRKGNPILHDNKRNRKVATNEIGEDMESKAVDHFTEKRGVRFFFEGRRRKQEEKNLYREEMRRMINGYAVCEETPYEGKKNTGSEQEEFGRTIYLEEETEVTHGLYTERGEMVVRIDKFPFVLGKRREDVDYVLSDYTGSRVHARFIKEQEDIYIEDLNATNGTFKNGLRLQPYEKRKLAPDDTLRFGKSTYIYK